MCGIVSMDEYLSGSRANSEVIGTYTKTGKKGDKKALLVTEYNRDAYVILSEDGINNRGFYDFGYDGLVDNSKEAQIARAQAYLTHKGYTPVAPSEPEPERVQGKTIAEWLQEGVENEVRPAAEHVHPHFEDGHKQTEAETQAWVGSLTGAEALMELASLLMGETDVVTALLSSASL